MASAGIPGVSLHIVCLPMEGWPGLFTCQYPGSKSPRMEAACLRNGTTSLLPRSIGQSQSQGQPKIKKEENKLYLIREKLQSTWPFLQSPLPGVFYNTCYECMESSQAYPVFWLMPHCWLRVRIRLTTSNFESGATAKEIDIIFVFMLLI